ncbi:phage antirepressor KilAC domain-containing protein [Modicisalibacter coralii]|uniref:phage antirepressor KilAC domain-containing protein n=1 Tax=Modicisalibacter coralii TaxID=2304602 RepID=UPI00100C1762|nr:phage antirepressor KilAC domain-containing protein [Halomonas coralii]
MNALVESRNTPTMTSLELVEFINSERGEGDARLRHDHFMAKVPRVLGDAAPKFLGTDHYTAGGVLRARNICHFPKREACLMAMSYSYDLQAKVFDRMTALEQQASKPALPDFTDPVAAARAWADEVEHKLRAEAALEKAKPAVEFVERYVSADSGNKGFRQVAKLLKANEREFRSFLNDQGVMYRLGGEWMPYQKHIDADRFVVKTGVTDDGAHSYSQAKFTPKGVNWIAGLWAQHNLGGGE